MASELFCGAFENILHHNYKMYRILKDGFIEIVEYDELLEKFSCTSYFFELKNIE
ncbi:hypothetical protein [Pectinatus frisingensis]|uniref:hypothetical protein n=1 Tax=Pectinatus frisingensis TaxID=865 RepID=UPI0018C4862F|nr:hypothetical protein [Pectinatus frisingensis]